jgi:hypothetical protein
LASDETALLLLLARAVVKFLVAVLEAEELITGTAVVMINSIKLALADPAEVCFVLHLQHLAMVRLVQALMALLRPIVLIAELPHPITTYVAHRLLPYCTSYSCRGYSLAFGTRSTAHRCFNLTLYYQAS